MMFEEFLSKLKEYARDTAHIESVIIVGSCARGTNKEDSDLDIVIITADKEGMVADQSFTQEFGQVTKQQTEYYGACTSVRAWYTDGKEVEYGIVAPSWMALPLDAGTHRVLSDGYRLIIDKKGHFKDLNL